MKAGRRMLLLSTPRAGLCPIVGLLMLPAMLVADVRLIGPVIPLPAAGPYYVAVCYNGTADAHLVIWTDVTDQSGRGWQAKVVRVDAATGAVLDATPLYISPNPAAIAAVTADAVWNPATGDWFVIYQSSDGGPDDVYGQRIAANGAKIGGAIPLVVKPLYQNSQAGAYNLLNDRLLVVWTEAISGTRQVVSRLFTGVGASAGPEVRLSEVSDRLKFNPKVAYNPVVNEFMVVWLDYRHWPGSGQDNDYGDIYGQRINGETGAKIGGNIPIYSPITSPPYVPNGQDSPNGISCNTTDGQYAIGITKLTAAYGWTTWGLVIDSDGGQVRPPFTLSHPQFGAQCTPAYNPGDGTYFISYEGPASNVAGKQVAADGTVVGGQQSIITTIGSIRDNALAARTGHGHFLQVAAGDNGVYVAQRFATGEPVVHFTASAAHRRNVLSWLNPTSPGFAGTLIRFSTTSFPQSPTDGTLLADRLAAPGSADGLEHSGLTNNVTYYYTAFPHTGAPVPEYGPPAFASGRPFLAGDFDGDDDVDQADFGVLQVCTSGENKAHPPGCDAADLEPAPAGDGDVDDQDLAVFLNCMEGPNIVPGC